MTYANELRRYADKVGRPSGDVPAVMHAAAAHIEDLERRLRAAEIRLHDVATLCANVESELAEIKLRTYVAVTCNHVGRMERAEARVAELEAERAEREKQEPVRLTDDQIGECIGDDADMQFETDPIKYIEGFARAIETAALRANNFDIQPARGGD